MTTRELSADPHPPSALREASYRLALLLVSIASIVVISADMALPLEPEVHRLLDMVDVLICAVLFFDFCRQLYSAESKRRYMLTWGWLDLISCIPAIDLFRYGRLIRVLRLIQMLRFIRTSRMLFQILAHYRARGTAAIALTVAVLALGLGSVAVLSFELRAPDPNIDTAGDALWWSFVTMTTVGYGDEYPTTAGGRAVAVALMFIGVGLFGVLSAILAAWIIGEHDKPDNESIHAELAQMREAIGRIEHAVADATPGDTPPGASPG